MFLNWRMQASFCDGLRKSSRKARQGLEQSVKITESWGRELELQEHECKSSAVEPTSVWTMENV